jgi:putative hydrolase
MKFEPHTHSNYSDGKSSLTQNVEAAIKKGLSSIALTDHGPAHMISGVWQRKMDAYLKEAKDLKQQYKNDIDVLVGLEFNLIDLDGKIDMLDGYESEFEWRVLGSHKSARFTSLYSGFTLVYHQFLGIKHDAILQRSTTAFIKAIEQNRIDMISHLGFVTKADVGKVAKACEKTGTLIELSGKHVEFSKADAKAVLNTKANFILGSDSHRASQVGVCKKGIDFAINNEIPLDRIVNLRI